LFAPKSGEETRDLLSKKADEGRDYAQRKARELRERADELIERSKDVAVRKKIRFRPRWKPAAKRIFGNRQSPEQLGQTATELCALRSKASHEHLTSEAALTGRLGWTMDTWVQIFVVVAAVAIVIQTAMLTALFLQMKRLSERLERFTGELESRLTPILSRVQIFLEDTQPKNFGNGRGCIARSVPRPRAGAKS